MKKILYISILLICTSLQAQIVDIPDPNFKNALVNTLCVAFDPDCVDVFFPVDTNQDGEIQVSEASPIRHLCIADNNITSLIGIEAFVSLQSLSVFDNQLETLDLSQNTKLKKLNCSFNNLTSLNIANSPNITDLNCGHNALPALDVTNNPQLTILTAGTNQLTAIDLSQNTNLTNLTLSTNALTSIDLSQNTNLQYVTLYNNQLSSFNIELLPNLLGLDCGNNNISNLSDIVSTQLENLSCYENPLTGYLNLSQNSNLLTLNCIDTQLTGINIQNGNNHNFILRAINMPNITCIQVDDVAAALQTSVWPYSKWEVDSQSLYSEDCGLGIAEHAARTLVLSPNPVKDSFTITTELFIQELNIFNLQGKLL